MLKGKQMKGMYVLIIENNADREVVIGKIGVIAFKKGFYAYVGSALSGLEQRVGRHLRIENKKMHWHIDYLLAIPGIEVLEVVCAESDESKECEIAAHLHTDLAFIENFGCSDCSCKSHLFFSTRLTLLREHVYRSFYSSGEHFLATKINPV